MEALFVLQNPQKHTEKNTENSKQQKIIFSHENPRQTKLQMPERAPAPQKSTSEANLATPMHTCPVGKISQPFQF